MPSQSNSDTAIGCLTVLSLAAVIWWLVPDKYAYAFEYRIDSDHVFVEKKANNCDWGHAPIGDKGCHYKKVVMPEKNAQDRVVNVYVSWERVED